MQKVVHPSNEFVCDVQPAGGCVVMRPAGELDLEVARAAAAVVVEELLDAGSPRVVVDLRELSFVDSSGVHMLVAARRSAQRRERPLSLVRGPRHVQRVLQLTGTESPFTFAGPPDGDR